jgi:dephospho-CoA kinase
VLADPPALARLERIVHPLVRAAQHRFLARQARRGMPLAVLDVPLLLETGGDRRVDAVVVVSAPALVQRQRALRRPGMTPARLAAILAKQMPDPAKRRRATFVLRSGADRGASVAAVRAVIEAAAALPAGAWPARWLDRDGGGSAP